MLKGLGSCSSGRTKMRKEKVDAGRPAERRVTGFIVFVGAIVTLLVVLAGDAHQITSARKDKRND